MKAKTAVLSFCSLLMLVSATARAQEFPPGYLDPEPILRAAETAIGTSRLSCVSISGAGYAGAVGQQRLNDKNVDWPRGQLNNYTRTMNWDARTMKETFARTPGQNPASWKHGSGWYDGTPTQQHPQQTFMVNGSYGWHMDGPDGAPVAARPIDAERWQLDL